MRVRRGILASFAGIAFALVVAVVFGSCFVWPNVKPATMLVVNDSDETVKVTIDTRVQKLVPPHSQRRISAGSLSGKWFAYPDEFFFDGSAPRSPIHAKCNWTEAKRIEPIEIEPASVSCAR